MNKISIPWHKVFVDVFILVFLCVLFFIFKYQLDTHKSGFFCNDFSVNMVFKNSTVPNILLFVISFVLPSLFIVGTEICRGVYVKIKPAGARHNRHSANVSNKYHLQLTSTREVVLSEPVGNIVINFMYFSLGHLCNSIVTLIGKKTIGRLRPNFLDVCKPEKNPYMTYCNTQLTGKTYLLPDIDFKCLTSDINPKEVEESRKSFPSGHSSSSFYAMIFLCIYVHRVYSKPSLGFLPHLLQTVFIATAVFIALSRIIDNKHHPTDVLAGSVLGVTIGLITSYYLNLFFRRFGYRPKYGLLTSSVATDYEMHADLDPETATNKTIVAANPDTNNTNSTTDGVDNRNS